MSSSLPENLIDQQPQPAQAPKQQLPLIAGLKRLKAARRAGQPFSHVARAVASVVLDVMSKENPRFSGGVSAVRREVPDLSEKAISKALRELSADGPFKLFECRRQGFGRENVYTLVWSDPEAFTKARDAGRARLATRARTYYLDESQQRQRLEWQKQLLMETLSEEDYDALMAAQDVKARTLSNGKVLPASVLDDIASPHWRERRRAVLLRERSKSTA